MDDITKHYSHVELLPCDVSGMTLHRVLVRGTRRHDPDGLFLLQQYETTVPDEILRKQRQLERLGLPIPHIALPEGSVQNGQLSLLCDLAGIHHVKPFSQQVSDPGAVIPDLQQIIQSIADALRAWNPACDLDRDTQSGYTWMQQNTPFSTALHAVESLAVGSRIFRNPAAWAMQQPLWQNALPVIMPTGYTFGRLDVSRIYTADAPFLIDVRGFEESGLVLLDWATLELSTLLHFMPLESNEDWSQWVNLCEGLCSAIVPTKSVPGRSAPHALNLVKPLREAVQTYMNEMSPSLCEWIETAFWLSATIAALRLQSDPESSDAHRKAAVVYGAWAFQQVGSALNLPKPTGEAVTVALNRPLELFTLSRSMGAAPFEHGYALIIGVGETKHASLSLPRARDDARAIQGFLTRQAGYAPEHLTCLVDGQATRTGIQSGFEWLRDQLVEDEKATAVVYYSGHGGVKGDQYFLVPYETDPKNILDTALPMTAFDQALADLRSERLVVLLDCCHAGSATLTKDSGADFTSSAPDPAQLTGRGRVLIASSTESQLSLILGGHPNSLFTEVLLEALKKPGEVEVLDVFKTLRDDVPRLASTVGFEQTPRFHAANLDRIILLTNR